MSEKIYAWLLRLFPSRFREAYGEEALQLVRDRCRDEKGFLLRLRLWLDLLGDLALSVPRAYFRVQPELTSYAAHLRSEGVPSLLILPDESLGAGTLLRSEEHTSELQSRLHLVCRLLLEKKKNYALSHSFCPENRSALYQPASNLLPALALLRDGRPDPHCVHWLTGLRRITLVDAGSEAP